MSGKIQLLGLRDYEDRHGKIKKKEDFFTKGWRAPSVKELLGNHEDFLKEIPPSERLNIFYTACQCSEERGRKLVEQHIIPFDIDHIDVSRVEETAECVLDALGLAWDSTAIIMSGHGLQLIVGIDKPITHVDYFKEKRKDYKELCAKVDDALEKSGLPGTADPAIWSQARLLRMPGTANGKPNLPFVDAELLQGNIVEICNPLDTAHTVEIGGEEVKARPGTSVSPKALEFLRVDEEGVRDCHVFKWMKETPDVVPEPVWYAALSVLGRVSNKMAHEYSRGHKDYTEQETEQKIEQAMEKSGPVTCEHFEYLADKCLDCPHKGHIKSPISIKSEGFIRTRDLGFRLLDLRKDPPIQGKPEFNDLEKFFYLQHPYIVSLDVKGVFTWDGRVWEEYPLMKIRGFAERHITFKPSNAERVEFQEKLLANNLKPVGFLDPYGYVNFQNGMMRLPGGKVTQELKDSEIEMEAFTLHPHRPELGMTSILPFDFEADAECPRFLQFMSEVTFGDKELIAILQEFMGYCLSNADAELGERALILLGDGSNGKSVFLDVFKNLVGKKNFASVPLNQLEQPTSRHELYGKMFNVTEETPKQGLKDSSVFKNLVTGGTMTIKKLYKDPATVKNNCKFIMAANELPHNTDTTKGMFRKILIVPFNARFEGKKIDRKIRQKLTDEIAGIFLWAIAGYNRLMANDFHFTQSDLVDSEVTKFEYLSDPLKVWASEHLEAIDDATVQTSLREMYMSYVTEMEVTRQRPTTLAQFGARMRKLYRFKKYTRQNLSGKKCTVVHGLKLLTAREF